MYASHYKNGQSVRAHSADSLPVHDSSTEVLTATVPMRTALEAEMAVAAALAALEGRAALAVETRVADLDKVAASVKAHTDELAWAIDREVGMPLKSGRKRRVG